jgi:hypothetical protein
MTVWASLGAETKEKDNAETQRTTRIAEKREERREDRREGKRKEARERERREERSGEWDGAGKNREVVQRGGWNGERGN